jgi:hypothetical protein
MSTTAGSRVEIRDLTRADNPLQALAESTVEINAAEPVEDCSPPWRCWTRRPRTGR